MATTTRQSRNIFLDDELTAGETRIDNQPVIPDGDRWRVTRLGGSCQSSDASAIIALQVRTALPNTWETVMGWCENKNGGNTEVQIDRDFIGDASGITRLRVIRINDATVTRRVTAYADAFEVS